MKLFLRDLIVILMMALCPLVLWFVSEFYGFSIYPEGIYGPLTVVLFYFFCMIIVGYLVKMESSAKSGAMLFMVLIMIVGLGTCSIADRL